MTKARTLANFISDGSTLADGAISVSEVSGAAPLASPSFTGTVDVANNMTVGGNDTIIAENNVGFKPSGAAYIDHHTVGQGMYFRLSNASSLDRTVFELGPDFATFNNGGHNQDFRVESDSDTNMLYVDAGNNRVSVGGGGPQARLNVFQNLNNSSDWWTNTRGALYLQNLNSSGHTVVKFNNETNTNASIVFNSTSSSGFQLFDRTSVEERLGVDSNELVINEGSQNFDFRVESDNYNHMLFVDASTDIVTIGGSDVGTHAGMFNVAGNLGVITGSGNPIITIKTGGTGNNPGINYRAGDSIIFDTTLIASASTDYWRVGHGSGGSVTSEVLAVTIDSRVGINDTTPSYTVDVRQLTNTADDGVNLQPNNQTQNMRYSFIGPTSTYFTEFMVDSTDSGVAGYRYFKFYEGTRDTDGELLYLGYNGTVFNEAGHNRNFRVESNSNTHALFVDAGGDNVLMGKSAPQSYENTAGTINVEATGSFSTSAVVKTGVGTTYVDSGWTFSNSRQVWLITLVGNNGTSNAHSTVAYIATVGAYNKTLVQLGNASDHYGNGYLSAQLDSSSAASVNLQVRWNSLHAGGTSDVTVQGLRLI